MSLSAESEIPLSSGAPQGGIPQTIRGIVWRRGEPCKRGRPQADCRAIRSAQKAQRRRSRRVAFCASGFTGRKPCAIVQAGSKGGQPLWIPRSITPKKAQPKRTGADFKISAGFGIISENLIQPEQFPCLRIKNSPAVNQINDDLSVIHSDHIVKDCSRIYRQEPLG